MNFIKINNVPFRSVAFFCLKAKWKLETSDFWIIEKFGILNRYARNSSFLSFVDGERLNPLIIVKRE